MDKEEQIKELAGLISDEYHPYESEPCFECAGLARKLYAAGYRRLPPEKAPTQAFKNKDAVIFKLVKVCRQISGYSGLPQQLINDTEEAIAQAER